MTFHKKVGKIKKFLINGDVRQCEIELYRVFRGVLCKRGKGGKIYLIKKRVQIEK